MSVTFKYKSYLTFTSWDNTYSSKLWLFRIISIAANSINKKQHKFIKFGKTFKLKVRLVQILNN